MWSYIGTLFGYLYTLAISLFAYIDQKLVNKISAIKLYDIITPPPISLFP